MSSADVDITPSTESAISSPMVAALESAWSAIRARHGELPDVVIVLGAGSGKGTSLTLGHFAAMRWHTPEPASADLSEACKGDAATAATERWAEVFIGGEGLARGAASVLATLLHEAAHALAHGRGIKDTSRQGRWHNARFKAIAEEVGIAVEKDPRLGWSPTRLPAETRTAYVHVIDMLTAVLRLHRSAEVPSGAATRPGAPAAVCECRRKIRVGKTVLAAGPIVCGICGGPFTFAAD